LAGEREIDTAWWDGGELRSRIFPSGSGSGTATYVATYNYDSAGRLNNVKNGAAYLVSSTGYNGRSQPTAIVYGNGVETDNFYDSRGFLSSVTTKLGATQHMDLAYSRDPAGRVIQVTNDAVTNNTENWIYVYDDFGQLIKADNLGQSGPDRSYAYDITGNMTCNSGIDSSIAAADRKSWCLTNTNIVYPTQGASSGHPHA